MEEHKGYDVSGPFRPWSLRGGSQNWISRGRRRAAAFAGRVGAIAVGAAASGRHRSSRRRPRAPAYEWSFDIEAEPDWIERVDLTEDFGHSPVLPVNPEARDCGAEPLDALPWCRRVNLDALAAQLRENMRAESDRRPMAEIHQEALSEAVRRDAAERVNQWHVGLAAGLRAMGIDYFDPYLDAYAATAEAEREARLRTLEVQAEIDGPRQVTHGELDTEFDREAGL